MNRRDALKALFDGNASPLDDGHDGEGRGMGGVSVLSAAHRGSGSTWQASNVLDSMPFPEKIIRVKNGK